MLLILSLLLAAQFCHGQRAYLFVKKGYKKKRTYVEGDQILLRLRGDTIIGGLITHLRADTIYIVGKPIPLAKVEAVIVRTKKSGGFYIPPKHLLLITGGVALTTAGLTLSNQAEFKEALTAGMVIGYGPLLVQYLASKLRFSRREFRIGRKFRLQMLDLHLPRQRRGF